ncbi:MAG: type IV pilus twitching motility protein PilT [Pyrinomonadaceae bacterium]
MKLENLLKTFAASNTNELRIEPDAKPYFVSEAGKTDAADISFTAAIISQLIFPIIPLEEKLRLPNLPQIFFRYTNELGMFSVTVAKSTGGLNVSIKKISVPTIESRPEERPQLAPSNSPVNNNGHSKVESVPVAPATPAVEKTEPTIIPPKSETGMSAPFFNSPNNLKSALPDAEAEVEEEIEDEIIVEEDSLPSLLREMASEVNSGESVLQKMNAPDGNLKTATRAEVKPTPVENLREPVSDAPILNKSVLSAPKMDALFYKMAEAGASDLHLSVSMPPMIRKDGKMAILEQGREVLTAEMAREMLYSIMPEKNREEFERRHDTDFAYSITGLARFRANIFMDRKGMGGVFRIIPTDILTAETLGLSEAILNLCNLNKGLVVVTGPTGSGKSTTLSAMIDYVNKNRSDHIITIEDPIEFVHENQKCLLNQREVHNHTDSFKDALRAALREDPDILLVGEMRDLETVSIAIETAETGHLVFGTLHTTTAPSTVDRIIDQFPADRQQQIRVMLSESLKGVIAQTLLPKIGGGRIAALEILIITPAISNLIREGKTFQIASAMQTGKQHGMTTLNDSLVELVIKGLVEPRDAYLKAIDKPGIEGLFKRNDISVVKYKEIFE